jgi:hypothetical protein
MFRFVALLFFVPLLLIESCAQNKSYVSTEGKFSIDLLTTPTEERNASETKLGGKKLWWKNERATFMVSYAVNTEAKKEFAERAVEASADAYSSAIPKAAEIVSRKKITLDGFPGIEVISREKDGYTATTRYFMVDTRLYCIMALAFSGPNDSYVTKTLNSFKLIT